MHQYSQTLYITMILDLKEVKIGVIGLGYVGLPLARLFATRFPVVGFDLKKNRIEELMSGHDSTLEVDSDVLRAALATSSPAIGSAGLYCTDDASLLADCNFYVVTVPTPVDKHNTPDLTPLYGASSTVGKYISLGDIVVYESTVYPGVTEDECIPVRERESGLKLNVDFFAGYSPERINPGDKLHTVEKIRQITSGSTPEVAELIDKVYSSVIIAGTFKASCIKVAETAKVIENSQRDINIAFMNELAKICALVGIDTHDVLEAASTKWNFLPFKPGLVGGHCIGVDPYYLAQLAQDKGYHPEVILAGRRINDGMGEYVAQQIVKCMIRKDIPINKSKVLVLGFTFKENCPDVRNTKVSQVVESLADFGVGVTVYDPWAKPAECMHEYGIEVANELPDGRFDAVVLCVAHDVFRELDIDSLRKEVSVVYDIKGFLPEGVADKRL